MKFKRRQYINDASLQIRFTLFFVLAALIGNILAVAAFNNLAVRALDTLMWSTHISVASTDELIRPIFIYVNVINFVFVTALLVLTCYLMMKKTSGPLLRMSNDIKKVTGGDLTSRIVLRQKDEFKDVADELNSMTEELRKRFAGIKGQYKGISESVGILEKGSSSKEDSIRSYNLILNKIEGIEKEINKFEL